MSIDSNNTTILDSLRAGFCSTNAYFEGLIGGTPTNLAWGILAGTTIVATGALIASRFKKMSKEAEEENDIREQARGEIEQVPVEIEQAPVEVQKKNDHAEVSQIFKRYGITEWHLPGQSSHSEEVGKESKYTPKVILTKTVQKEIAKFKEKIKDALETDTNLPNLIIQGETGTGKSMLAQDLALNTGVGFIRITSSQINSALIRGKVGEMMSALFQIAADALTPIYLIGDDIERFVQQRPMEAQPKKDNPYMTYLDKEDEITNSQIDIVNTILGDAKKVGYIMTTNRGEVIDNAFRSRCTTVLFEKPDEEQRSYILATHIPKIFKENLALIRFFDFGKVEHIAKETEGFKGRDLVKLLKDIAAGINLDPNQIMTSRYLENALNLAKKNFHSEFNLKTAVPAA